MIKNNLLLTFFVCMFLGLSACGQGAPTTQADSQADSQKNTGENTAAASTADRVLAAYHVRAMLEQARPIIQEALLANLPAAVGKQQREFLHESVEQAYTTENLLAQVSENLSSAAKSEGNTALLAEAATLLESDLAQRMVELDDAAATDEFADEFGEFLQQPVEESSEARIQAMRGLAEDLRLVELQTVFNIGMMRGMIVARNAASPENYSMSQESADNMVKQTREGLHEHLNEQIPIMLFFAYREVEQPQLDKYIALQKSDAVSWTNEAMIAALARAFASAAQQVPERYNAMVSEDSA